MLIAREVSIACRLGVEVLGLLGCILYIRDSFSLEI